jgi:hypothetical protein
VAALSHNRDPSPTSPCSSTSSIALRVWALLRASSATVSRYASVTELESSSMMDQSSEAAGRSAAAVPSALSPSSTIADQINVPATRYECRIAGSGAPCSARRRPVARGGPSPGVDRPASRPRMKCRLSRIDACRSAAGTTLPES